MNWGCLYELRTWRWNRDMSADLWKEPPLYRCCSPSHTNTIWLSLTAQRKPHTCTHNRNSWKTTGNIWICPSSWQCLLSVKFWLLGYVRCFLKSILRMREGRKPSPLLLHICSTLCVRACVCELIFLNYYTHPCVSISNSACSTTKNENRERIT